MKKNIILVALVTFLVVGFVSCKKYEQGPGLSFRSKTKRLANSWRIQSVTVNGVERAAEPLYAKQKHYIYESGSYIINVIDPITLQAEDIQGTWQLYDENRKLAVNRVNYNGVADSLEDYQILKLKEKSLWLRKLDNTIEYHFVPFDEPGQ